MRWLGGERLFDLLQEVAPTGMRDADPVFWQLRLDALRMANRVSGQPAYEWTIATLDGRPALASNGLRLTPTANLGDVAGQVFSAHGSGIGAGLVAARMVGEALAKGRPYDYAVAWQRRFGGTFAASSGLAPDGGGTASAGFAPGASAPTAAAAVSSCGLTIGARLNW